MWRREHRVLRRLHAVASRVLSRDLGWLEDELREWRPPGRLWGRLPAHLFANGVQHHRGAALVAARHCSLEVTLDGTAYTVTCGAQMSVASMTFRPASRIAHLGTGAQACGNVRFGYGGDVTLACLGLSLLSGTECHKYQTCRS